MLQPHAVVNYFILSQTNKECIFIGVFPCIFHANLVSSYVVIYHCKSERSVLAVQIGPFRWVRFSPILGGSYVAPLIRAHTVQLPWADLDPRAEMSPIVNCDWIALGEANQTLSWSAELAFRAVTNLFIFQYGLSATLLHDRSTPLNM